jgi:methylated-DNA-[protein]-cysteine S-methyltransferase
MAVKFRYATLRSPVGPLTVVESDRGVVVIEFGEPDAAALLERLRAAGGDDVVLERRARLRATTEIGEYFRGRRRTFGVATDFRLTGEFQGRVLRQLMRVSFGQLTTYGDLAKRVGKPGAARAVGAAMAKNPLPILVPCHRVVASDGSLGGFSGGLDVKRRLHVHEGVAELDGGWNSAGAR